jgi:hypothetical protein
MMLSTEQQQIITFAKDYNLIVNACAGSGKTTTIIYLAKEYPKMKMLLLTYNKRLKLETRTKITNLEINNLDVHTYHSFCVKYYKKKCYTNNGIIKLLNEKCKTQIAYNFDLIIIDEAQDMTPLYYELVIKIINENNSKVSMSKFIHQKGEFRLCLLGDELQSIYGFNGADARFLTMADKIFTINNREWKKLTLSTSFRITNQMAHFVNKCLLKYDKINTCKDGEKVKYIITDCFGTEGDSGIKMSAYNEISQLLKNGYTYDDIFILAPSLRNDLTPVRKLANILSFKKNIPIYVPLNDDEELNDNLIKGKIVFSTYHQTKGLERKIVFVFNFDESYFKFYERDAPIDKCPNTLYVAATRAIDKLIILHHYQNDYLPFINQDELRKCKIEKLMSIYISNFTNQKKYIDTPVTNLTRHLNDQVVTKALSYLIIEEINPPDNKINISTQVKFNDLLEEVSDITGTAIPAYFEFITTNYMSIYNKMKTRQLQYVDFDNLKPDKLLYIANEWNAFTSGYVYKLKQINKYDWLSQENLDLCINRLKGIISRKAKFEIKKEVYGRDELKDRKLVGYIDCIDENNIYEFKCVNELKDDHILQLATYMYMFNNENYNYYLFNILDNKILKISASNDNLREMIKYIIEEKYGTNKTMSDEHFVNYITSYCNKHHSNNNNICVLDIETDGDNTIIQIAYNIYDENRCLLEKCDYLLNDNSGNVDYYKKFTLDDIEKYGLKPEFVLNKLSNDLKKCKYIIGHNIANFDIVKLKIYYDKYKIKFDVPIIVDTMILTRNYVDAKSINGKLKNPKLNELYYKLFNENMNDNAHDASYDIHINFLCYNKLITDKIIKL